MGMAPKELPYCVERLLTGAFHSHPNLGPVFTICGSWASVETTLGTDSSNSQLTSPWANIVAPIASRTKRRS